MAEQENSSMRKEASGNRSELENLQKQVKVLTKDSNQLVVERQRGT
jgi:hypothetical protein